MADDDVVALRAEVARLRAALAEQEAAAKAARPKIAAMSGEVVDSNPYSRLMALKRMGIVPNYEDIRKVSVCVVGLGGIGSIAAEMLARCGVGRLLLYDYDRVELANMNRLFFRPEHAGMLKTDAAALALGRINPDVRLDAHGANVTGVAEWEAFCGELRRGSVDGQRAVDLVLSCVDNFEARMAVNQACNELDLPWMESGVSEDAVSGHIQFLVPGVSACFQCAPPLIVASGVDEKTLKREGVCAASLPTTMAIVAGLLVQNALKHLLAFGHVAFFQGYGAMRDDFPAYVMRPNPQCTNAWCLRRQQQHRDHPLHARLAPPTAAAAAAAAAPVEHKDNSWGITLEADNAPAPAPAAAAAAIAPAGLEFAYDMPVASPLATGEPTVSAGDSAAGIDDLAAQLKALAS